MTTLREDGNVSLESKEGSLTQGNLVVSIRTKYIWKVPYRS